MPKTILGASKATRHSRGGAVELSSGSSTTATFSSTAINPYQVIDKSTYKKEYIEGWIEKHGSKQQKSMLKSIEIPVGELLSCMNYNAESDYCTIHGYHSMLKNAGRIKQARIRWEKLQDDL